MADNDIQASQFDLLKELDLHDVPQEIKDKINAQFAKNVILRSLHAIASQLSKDDQVKLIRAIEGQDFRAAYELTRGIQKVNELIQEEAREELQRVMKFVRDAQSGS